MAKIRRLPVIGEMSGKVGQVVVKRYADKYVVTSIPAAPLYRSAKQKAHAQRFKEAMEYAKLANMKPPTDELYGAPAREQGKAANTIAVSDFFRPPVIRKVDAGNYGGQAGDSLNIVIENIIPVRRVTVSLLYGKGKVLERGYAKLRKDNLWTYTAKQDIPDRGQSQDGAISVIVTATDHPDNVVKEQVEVPITDE